MFSCVQVVKDDEDPVADSCDLVACLTRVAPNLELVIVTTSLVQVFALVEPRLLFQIIAAVIEIE